MAINRGMRIHFIGVGGIGMSALAQICSGRGAVVSGCDVSHNGLASRLRSYGISIEIGHSPSHLALRPHLVVYSAAVPADTYELIAARELGIRTITRGELLAELAEDKRLIAVAGAHGKTTTAGMASQLLAAAGWDPTIAVGGLMLSTGTNAHFGRGRYLVAETDESDGSFLRLSPQAAIITNIDREHLNHYQTLERVIYAFQQFVDQIKPGGTLIRCYDNEIVRRELIHSRQLSYGLDNEADVMVRHASFKGYESEFVATFRGRDLGAFRLKIPGWHNVLNALSIISLGIVLDIPIATIRESLANFRGTKRRFQAYRIPGDIWMVEDYAHHPAEIQATLSGEVGPGRRRVAVFQPHRFSRTQLLEREFTRCFDAADGVIVTDIYSAFEKPIAGISGKRLASLIHDHGHPCVRYVPRQELGDFVSCMARAGDTMFFLGAGDIGELCYGVASRMCAPRRAAC